MQRKSVNFVGSSAAVVEPFFDRHSAVRRALQDLIDEELVSESDVLRALVTVGIKSVTDRQLEFGYSTWAAAEDEEDRSWSTASTSSLAERAGRDGS